VVSLLFVIAADSADRLQRSSASAASREVLPISWDPQCSLLTTFTTVGVKTKKKVTFVIQQAN
jgi:hypothetical protein